MSLTRLLFVRIPYLIAGSLLLAAIAINMANVIGRDERKDSLTGTGSPARELSGV